VPVLATHTGYRFGAQEYMLETGTLRRIAERNGVVGLIFAQHQLHDGIPTRERRRSGFGVGGRRRFDESFEVLCRHIDRIREVTGSNRHTAIGSDLDGFIKPTLVGLDDMRDMAALERALRGRYGDEEAEMICSGNSLRVLSSFWRGDRHGEET
jgi:microsomal dipeptidase-like Zn-dependent dipeptidase